MKHLLKILPFILLCLACSNDDEPMQQKTRNIGFSADVKQSRAVAAIADIQAGGFSVWGGFTGTQVFDARKVIYSSGAWVYDNPEVWTFNEYNFHAVYPAVDAAAYTSAIVAGDNRQVEITGFDAATGVDLLHATKLNVDGSAAPLVDLNFKHTLTGVTIELAKHSNNAADAINVTQVYLLGMYTKGDYTWTPDTVYWTIDDTQDPSYTGSTFAQVALDTNYKEFLSDILMIPQPVDPVDYPVVLVVAYDFIVGGLGETIKDNVLIAYLPESVKWEPNKHIKYRAIIEAQKNITFATPIVESWGSEQVGGTIIIK